MDNLNQHATSSQPLSSVRPNQTIPLPPNSPTPSKTFIILLVVMLIVMVGVGGYTLGIKHGKTIVQNQQTTTSPTIAQLSPAPDPTANWKTYTNTKYNYQIKYPPDWVIEVDGIVVWQDAVPNPELGKQIIFFKSTVHEPYIWIIPYPNPKQLSLKDHLLEEILKPIDFPTGDPKEQVSRMKPIIIPGVEEALEESDPSDAPLVHLHKSSITILLALNYGDNPNIDTSTKTFAKQTFYQILSTFKFTDQNQSPSPTPYIPLNPQIEEEGKLKVKNTPEVKTLIGKYGKSSVSIKALDVKLVKDIQFIMQLDPRFKEQTGCIIVVESNNSGYVYQLDKNNDVLYRQTLEEFKQKTANVDQQILEKFYASLS